MGASAAHPPDRTAARPVSRRRPKRLGLARGARAYVPADDLGVVTCYFNPGGYRTRLRNYRRFAATLERSRVHWLVVECAFGSDPFTLPPSPRVVRVRARDVMWQKERLLNVAVAHLPATCTKVAWLDCDVLFANSEWAVETSALLERWAVVQPFKWVVRLPRGFTAYWGLGDVWKSFGAVYAHDPARLVRGSFDKHGHTGFAWAARRELLERRGLYDACIAGSADHMMAHAMGGDWATACIDRIIGDNTPHREYFRRWAEGFHADVRGRVGYVHGTLLHLWHGDIADRRYVDRNQDLVRLGFDPATDLRVGAGGSWEWARDKPALHRWAVEYFGARREDGPARGFLAALAGRP